MPIYEIEAPNGKTYQIEGPEGASQEEIQNEVMRQNAADFQDTMTDEQPEAPAARMANSEFQAQFSKMMNDGRPAQELIDFADQHGMIMEDKDREWLLGDYTRGVARGRAPRRPVNVPPDPERPEAEKTSATSAAWKGLQSSAMFGFDDEWAGLWGAIGNKAGNLLGLNDTTAGFWDVYDAVRERHNEAKDRAWEERPGAYALGYVPGLFMGPSFLKGSGQGGKATMRDFANAGAAQGALAGAGNSDEGFVNRLEGAAGGGTLGYLLGGATKPVVDTIGTLANRGYERLRPSGNNLNSGLDALAIRADLDPAEMAARAAELERLGIDPRLLDVVGEEGRSVISGAAGRAPGASDDLARAADDVYVDAQDRIAQQARSRIAPESENVGAEQIASTTERLRNSTMEAQMEGVRAVPVPVTDDVVAVLATAEGRTALKQAQRMMIDRGDREAVDGILAAVKQLEKIDPRMPPAARAQIEQQIMADVRMTVDMADKFARAMKGRGKSSPGLERVAENFANTVRDAARREAPEYNRALGDYEDAFRTVDAARGTGRFEDSNVLSTEPRQFADRVAETSDARPRFVDDAGEETLGASTNQAFRTRAADDIARAAQEGSGSNALNVARRLARGSNQQVRNEALLGREGAADLQAAAEGELNRVVNTRFIDPRIGSQTARRLAERDQIGDEAINAAAGASLSWTYSLVRTVGRFLRDAGMKEVDAERLVRDAIDPARTNDALAYLVQRGMPKNKAMELLRVVRQQAAPYTAGRVGGEIAGDERPRNPRSIRLMTTVRRTNEPHVRVPLEGEQ